LVKILAAVSVVSFLGFGITYSIDLNRKGRTVDRLLEEVSNFNEGGKEKKLIKWLISEKFHLPKEKLTISPTLFSTPGIDFVKLRKEREQKGYYLSQARLYVESFCGKTSMQVFWRSDEEGNVEELYFSAKACWIESL